MYFTESEEMCGHVRSLYDAGRKLSARDSPAMPRVGGARFTCKHAPASELPLQAPREPIRGQREGRCGNAAYTPVWYNKINWMVEAADMSRRHEIPKTLHYAWLDGDIVGPGVINSLLDHPLNPRALEEKGDRVHFRCYPAAMRSAQPSDPQ